MLTEQYKKMLSGKSVIRQLSEFATERGKEIGYENVFDYSLGNPSVPVPEKFTEVMIKMLQEKSPVALHGYSLSIVEIELTQTIGNPGMIVALLLGL